MSQAFREPHGYQIGAHDLHGRNRGRCAVSGKNPGRRRCHENVDIESDQFGGERRQPGVVAIRVAIFYMDVLALDPAEFAKPGKERLDFRIPGRGREKAHAGDPLRLLSTRG